jgi:hypothetical protein
MECGGIHEGGMETTNTQETVLGSLMFLPSTTASPDFLHTTSPPAAFFPSHLQRHSSDNPSTSSDTPTQGLVTPSSLYFYFLKDILKEPQEHALYFYFSPHPPNHDYFRVPNPVETRQTPMTLPKVPFSL